MLAPAHVCDLAVDPLAHPRGQPYLSAVSGLVRVGEWLYLVADDEHHLGLLPATGVADKRVQMHRLAEGDLPADATTRKRLKPDLEALLALPPALANGDARLLALGSGSRPNRERAFLLQLDGAGQPRGARDIDLGPLYRPLASSFGDLNIEGAFVSGRHLHLLQRANRGNGGNHRISFDLAAFLRWLDGADAPVPTQVAPLALGAVQGVPYGITDAAALPEGGWIFSAVAENTDDSYADGTCVGSAIGWFDGRCQLQRLCPLQGAPKVEGIALAGDGRLLMATDADDPAQPSQLLQLALDVLRASPPA
jgi:hypothetical protein